MGVGTLRSNRHKPMGLGQTSRPWQLGTKNVSAEQRTRRSLLQVPKVEPLQGLELVAGWFQVWVPQGLLPVEPLSLVSFSLLCPWFLLN